MPAAAAAAGGRTKGEEEKEAEKEDGSRGIGRGRALRGESGANEDEKPDGEDDDGLGGCTFPPLPLPFLSLSPQLTQTPFFSTTDGFFDAGMLLQALERPENDDGGGAVHARHRAVGKKLRLSEY